MPMRLLGDAGAHNQYHLYDIAYEALTIGRDVAFDETSVFCPPRDNFLDFDKSSRAPVTGHTKFNLIQSSPDGEVPAPVGGPVQNASVLESESDSEVDGPELELEPQPPRPRIFSRPTKACQRITRR